MNDFLFASVEIETAVPSVDQNALVFVNDAEYEFVGGGASVYNGY